MDGYQPNARELEMLGRQEREARERLHAARNASLDEGITERQHSALIRKLEAEWREARKHLHRARKS